MGNERRRVFCRVLFGLQKKTERKKERAVKMKDSREKIEERGKNKI